MRSRLPAVLLYHRIAAPDGDPLGLTVSPARFERQLRLLRDAGFASVKLDDACVPTAERRVAITFDDGSADLFTDAFPLLQRYGFTATAFVVTGCIGAEGRWEVGRPVPMLGWRQIAEMARHGITFQSHTRTHPDLTRCADATVMDELAGSRAELEDRTGAPARAIAYPYGRFDARILRLAVHAGYASGWAAGLSTAGAYARERMQIKSSDALPLFAIKASGWGGWFRRSLRAVAQVEGSEVGLSV